MARIGFIGLGHMGLPMAINLIRAKHDVTGYDLQTSAVEALVAAGGIPASSCLQAAQSQDIVITMLQTGKQVEEVCLGEKGIFNNIKKEILFIDCSSIDVIRTKALHWEAQARGIAAVDAPVSGGVAGATAGTLTCMVGGEEEAFSKAQTILKAVAKKIIHTGKAGSGQAAKICNNMILGISMIAVSEAFLLAEQLELTPQKLQEVVSNASGQCWVMNQYVPVPNVLPNVPANHAYQPGFTAAMMLKDLHLSQQAAASVGLKTPIAALATNLYQSFNDKGMGELDFSGIIKMCDNSE